MKRRKKWLSIAAVLMTVFLLAGCSSAELNMLSNGIRVVSMNDAQMTGTVTITPNQAGIQKGLERLKASGILDRTKYDEYGREIWDLSQKGPSLIESLSSHTYRMDYEIHRRYVEGVLTATMDFSGSVDGKTLKPLGQLVLKGEEEILCSSGLLLNGYAMIAEAVRVDGCQSLLFTEEFEKQLNDILNGVDFVRTDLGPEDYDYYGDYGDYGDCGDYDDYDYDADPDWDDEVYHDYELQVDRMRNGLEQLKASPEAVKELTDLIVEFLKTTLSGYSSDLVRTIGGGQEFSATLRQCADALFGGLDVSLKDSARFAEELAKLFRSFDQLMMKHQFWTDSDYAVFEELYLWEYTELMDMEDLSALESLRSGARLAQGMINMAIMNFEDSKINLRITPREGGFDQSFRLGINWKGTDLITVEEQYQLRPETAELILPKAQKPLEDTEFAEKLNGVINRLNPAVSAELEWYEEDWKEYPWYEENEAMIWISYHREKDGGFLQNDFDRYSGYFIDGNLYVPLREVAAQFGETVGYDKEERSAYVQRDGARTLFEGIVRDGVTYVKIRDFEKLGYVINYQKDEYGDALIRVSKAK